MILYGTLSDQTMLEFTEVFPKGYKVYTNSTRTRTIMECKNIDFGHVDWFAMSRSFYNNAKYMSHIIDNIIDINTHDNNLDNRYTLFGKIVCYSSTPSIVHYMFNNGRINDTTFEIYFRILQHVPHRSFCKCCPHKQFNKLTNYLTKVSLDKFKGYYNLEKYYDMIYVMLLIMKAQQRLPTSVVKHLIIPFVYQ